MLYLAKGNFQKMIRWMAGSWMTANQATFLGIVFIILSTLSYYLGLSLDRFRWFLLLVPFFLFMRMAMNALDGMLAREYKTGSARGELWNEGVDVLGDILTYGVLYFVPGGPRSSLVVFLMSIWAAEFFGVLGKGMPGGTRRYENVAAGKPDRAFWMGILAITLFFKPAFMHYVPYYLGVLSLLLFLTCVLRIKAILSAAKGKPYESYTWVGR